MRPADALVPDDWDVVFFSSFLEERPPRGRIAGAVYGSKSWHGSSATYLVTRDAAPRCGATWCGRIPIVNGSDVHFNATTLRPPGS